MEDKEIDDESGHHKCVHQLLVTATIITRVTSTCIHNHDRYKSNHQLQSTTINQLIVTRLAHPAPCRGCQILPSSCSLRHAVSIAPSI